MTRVLMTRAVVMAMALSIPAYAFILVHMLPFRMTPFGNEFLDTLFHFGVVPIIFSVTWDSIIYLRRYRMANTVYLARRSTGPIPLRWRVFYGANALFVSLFFVLPLVTPIVSMIGGIMLASTVVYRAALGRLGMRRISAAAAVVVASAVRLRSIFVLLQFAPGYLLVWERIQESWSSFWVGVVQGVSQCLVNALSWGAPVHFIWVAAQEYDRGVYGMVYTRIPMIRVRLFEATLFMIFLCVYLPPIPTPIGTLPFLNASYLFNQYINYISMAVVAVVLVTKRALGMAENSTMGGVSNITVVGLFLMIEVFYKTNLIVVNFAIWLAFILFAGLIVINYMRASSRELY
ncbi:MAG: hypothetical protein QXQ81_03880 [Candidatus Thorarchaeota archaeon]